MNEEYIKVAARPKLVLIVVAEYSRNSAKLPLRLMGQNGGSHDHICWRKFAVNAEEYSTEL